MRKWATNWGTTALQPIHYASSVLLLRARSGYVFRMKEPKVQQRQQTIDPHVCHWHRRKKIQFCLPQMKREKKKVEAETHAELLRTIPVNQKTTSTNLFYSFGVCDACNGEYEEFSCGRQ